MYCIMKNAFKALGISTLILGGTSAGFSLGIFIGYMKDATMMEREDTLHDARENKTDRR